MIKISEKGKAMEGRGQGEGIDYKPYIQAREFNSAGTCSNPIDWKTGRTVELLSQGEATLWHLLRWSDDVTEIKEQYPLELERTRALADKYGVKHPHSRETAMTTDFLVSFCDGKQRAISLKASRTVMEKPRTVEKLFLEKCYWNSMQVPFQLIFKDELNMILTQNIRMVVEYYTRQSVHDNASVLKHLIATKQITPNIREQKLDIPYLVNTYHEEIEKWKTSK